jgi:8-oxo-dGTP pyrophosphatase MutT (NUDIX family)
MDRRRPPTRETLNEGPATIPRQAASVILLRETGGGFELLLVKRSPAQRFMGGYWVFPGGAVDAADATEGVEGTEGEGAENDREGEGAERDREGAGEGDREGEGAERDREGAGEGDREGEGEGDREAEGEGDGEGEAEGAHRAAAVRELHEEAGVRGISAAELVRYSRWITPELLRIRFDTHFFLALAPAGTVAACDGRECVAARWGSPHELLADYARDELTLAFPTLRHLEQLSAFATTRELLEHSRAHVVRPVLPRVVRSGEIAWIVLPGEPGYDTAAGAPGDV